MTQKSNKIVTFSRLSAEPQRTFRDEINIPDDVLRDISEKGKQYGIETVLPFTVDEFELGEWVGLKCRYGCSQYGTNWSCPPATPDFSQARAIISEYSIALLLIGTQKCTNFYINNSKKRSEQVRYWKGTVSLERQLFLHGYDKAFSLVSGSCSLCRKCAYPEACRFPTEKRPTIESLAVDVIGTLKNLGIDTRVARDPKELFKYYAVILLV
jgi:predicted metal-binding protein